MRENYRPGIRDLYLRESEREGIRQRYLRERVSERGS